MHGGAGRGGAQCWWLGAAAEVRPLAEGGRTGAGKPWAESRRGAARRGFDGTVITSASCSRIWQG